MDPQDLRTLQLLEEIEKNHMPFKITHIPKNRVRYILTPKGAAEKTRLTYAYIRYSYTFYKDARRKLRELFRDLEQHGARRLAFYGTGDLAEIAFLSLQEASIELVAVIDDQKAGKKFMGHPVKSPQNLKGIAYDCILITAVESVEDIQQTLVGSGISRDHIVVLH